MRIARERYNPYVVLIEDAQTDIREIVRRAFLSREPKDRTEKKLEKVIREAVGSIEIGRLKRDVAQALIAFANKQRRLWLTIGLSPEVVMFLATERSRKNPNLPRPGRVADELASIPTNSEVKLTYDNASSRGVPLGRFYSEVWRELVVPAIERAAASVALDPNDYSGRNSLRNLAEMEVRYHDHLDNIAELKARGVRLVVCSSHADCSSRCAPWQGRVYSLDGSSGVIDGHRYVPLETATDIWYTTKAGRRYKNGLLGFNCYDDKTEVYTSDGWKHFAELNGTELFYTLDTATKTSEWQEASEYYRSEYCGDMVHFTSATTDICVTPNHSMLVYSSKKPALRFIDAVDCTATHFFTAGQQWHDNDVKTVILGGKTVNADLYFKFMAYYLADGSRHAETAVKIAQTNNDEMYAELRGLPFKVWRDKEKIVIHGRELAEELAAYGVCDKKYIPETVKNASRRQIRLFLSAFIATDGYKSKPHNIDGYMRQPHLSVFTTSRRMADDLTELAMKAGYRPKTDTLEPTDKSINFKNGAYASKKVLYVIHLNRRTNITKTYKVFEPYSGYVYCVTVPNHTLLVRRNGRTVWCGNCRHRLEPYVGQLLPTVTAAERKAEYRITLNQRRLEREVRHAKVNAAMNKGLDSAAYRNYLAQAREASKRYSAYCKENGRATYPMRTAII